MKILGRKLVGKAEEAANVVGVPMTRGLGLSELLKRTFEEACKDQLDAFAGNLTYKVLFALFPSPFSCSPCSTSLEPRSSSTPSSTGQPSCCRRELVPF